MTTVAALPQLGQRVHVRQRHYLLPLLDCIQQSDYRELKARHSRAATTPTELLEQLIRPRAADAGNLGIQLRSTAELGAA